MARDALRFGAGPRFGPRFSPYHLRAFHDMMRYLHGMGPGGWPNFQQQMMPFMDGMGGMGGMGGLGGMGGMSPWNSIMDLLRLYQQNAGHGGGGGAGGGRGGGGDRAAPPAAGDTEGLSGDAAAPAGYTWGDWAPTGTGAGGPGAEPFAASGPFQPLDWHWQQPPGKEAGGKVNPANVFPDMFGAGGSTPPPPSPDPAAGVDT